MFDVFSIAYFAALVNKSNIFSHPEREINPSPPQSSNFWYKKTPKDGFSVFRGCVILIFNDLFQASLDMGQSLVEEAPVPQPAEVFQLKGAGPSREPLGGTKGRGGITTPTGMGDSLILTSRRAESSVYHQRSVRNSLSSVAPERKGAFSPLPISRKLPELQE